MRSVLFLGVVMRSLGMPMSLLTMVVGARGMLLGYIVLARFVMMGGLIMVMGGGVMAGRRLMVVFRRRVFALVGHVFSPG
jgi:hypothetical protein